MTFVTGTLPIILLSNRRNRRDCRNKTSHFETWQRLGHTRHKVTYPSTSKFINLVHITFRINQCYHSRSIQNKMCHNADTSQISTQHEPLASIMPVSLIMITLSTKLNYYRVWLGSRRPGNIHIAEVN